MSAMDLSHQLWVVVAQHAAAEHLFALVAAVPWLQGDAHDRLRCTAEEMYDTQLTRALAAGDVAACQWMVDSGVVGLAARIVCRCKGVEVAASSGSVDACRWAFAHRGQEPRWARAMARAASVPVLQWLHGHAGAECDWACVLDRAVRRGRMVVVQWLVEGGRVLIQPDTLEDRPQCFYQRARCGDLAMCQWMAAHLHLTYKHVHDQKARALCAAARAGHADVAAWILCTFPLTSRHWRSYRSQIASSAAMGGCTAIMNASMCDDDCPACFIAAVKGGQVAVAEEIRSSLGMHPCFSNWLTAAALESNSLAMCRWVVEACRVPIRLRKMIGLDCLGRLGVDVFRYVDSSGLQARDKERLFVLATQAGNLQLVHALLEDRGVCLSDVMAAIDLDQLAVCKHLEGCLNFAWSVAMADLWMVYLFRVVMRGNVHMLEWMVLQGERHWGANFLDHRGLAMGRTDTFYQIIPVGGAVRKWLTMWNARAEGEWLTRPAVTPNRGLRFDIDPIFVRAQP